MLYLRAEQTSIRVATALNNITFGTSVLLAFGFATDILYV